MIRQALPIICAAWLVGCTLSSAEHYPSLAPRPAESKGFEEPSPAPPAPAVPDPELDAKIATATRTLADAQHAFDAAAATAKSRTARAKGQPAGSDAWLDAQTALGELDVARASAADPLSDLEQMAMDRAAALSPSYPALDAALSAARARVSAMSRQIGEIQSGLAR